MDVLCQWLQNNACANKAVMESCCRGFGVLAIVSPAFVLISPLCSHLEGQVRSPGTSVNDSPSGTLKTAQESVEYRRPPPPPPPKHSSIQKMRESSTKSEAVFYHWFNATQLQKLSGKIIEQLSVLFFFLFLSSFHWQRRARRGQLCLWLFIHENTLSSSQ